MKKLVNKILEDLEGEPLTTSDKDKKTVPLTIVKVLLPHFNTNRTSGEEAIKIYQLGCKIADIKNGTAFILLEDAELELLQKICDPPEKIYGAVVYGQLELAFASAEDHKIDEK